MRPSPDHAFANKRGFRTRFPAPVLWILVVLLPATTLASPGTPGSEAEPPVPVVKTVEWEVQDPETPVRATPPRAAPVRPPRGKGPRTLDEITIEGEIAVPQVLFITARDRKRYRDLLHRRYLENSTEIGRDLAIPARLGSMLGS